MPFASFPRARISHICAIALSVTVAATTAQADDVTDAIAEAAAAYEEGDLAYAKESLEFATQLIGQMKTGTLATLLPEPLAGWEAGEVDTETMGAALFGGGSTASRDYTKGDKTVSIQYTANSPIVAQMAGMFSAAAMGGGGKLIRLGRQKAMVDEDGGIQFVVDNSVMVTVDGNASTEEMKAYAKAIDIKALKDY